MTTRLRRITTMDRHDDVTMTTSRRHDVVMNNLGVSQFHWT
jgi:hypothetical protein